MQRINVKRIVDEAKKESWKKIGKSMEEDFQGNQKLYGVLRNIKRKKGNELTYQRKNNQLITSDEEIIERWKEHFEEVLNNKRVNTKETKNVIELEDEEEKPTTRVEMEEALKKLKMSKSPNKLQTKC